MDTSLSKLVQSGGKKGSDSRVLSMPDQQITALPIRPFRESHSSLNAPQTRAYGKVLSHNPQASFSSQISPDPFSHRRRGSTLKVVMRRIFGKKRNSNLDGEEETEGLATIRQQTVDTSIGPSRLLLDTPNLSDSSSSPSLSKRKRSLATSHLSSASSDHIATAAEEKRIEISNQVLRRRATLPSLILTEDDDTKKSIYSSISPTSMGPISAVDEDHENLGDHEEHEDSRSQPSFRAHRRSRSADALRELVRHHRMSPIQWRRRSDEIKFWRTSVLEMDEGDPEVEKLPTSAPVVSTKTGLTKRNLPKALKSDLPLRNEPVSAPFQFENLIASMADPDATVEQRLTTIEVKLMDLEFAISKIQGTDTNCFPGPAESSTKQEKAPEAQYSADNSLSDPSLASETSSHSSLSFGGRGESRPISTSTLRPNVIYPLPPSERDSSWSTMNLTGISIEQYSALVTLVRREQTARKALETQVTQLQEEMQQFRRASGLPASPPGTLYPIPSPDSDDARFRRRRPTESTRKDSSTSADTKLSDTRTRDSAKYRFTRETNSRNDSNMI